jgi:hypothetical protein
LQCANGRTLWFKAVLEPNTREYGLTQELTRQFPEYLTKLVAWIPEWHGWISERVVGVPLKGSKDPAVWEEAFKVLASMQRQPEYHLDSLRAAGAKDLTTCRLWPLLAPFFAEAEDVNPSRAPQQR